ncbi:hypothetical protein RJT34_30588 [Clitoria ternatea]|uniref:Ammonium transporter AmtB-like domain-containing protein n=1 Tax=Clitoria ternatea TaxID=43366 RepID=A0AAN9I2S5_CLITE
MVVIGELKAGDNDSNSLKILIKSPLSWPSKGSPRKARIQPDGRRYKTSSAISLMGFLKTFVGSCSQELIFSNGAGTSMSSQLYSTMSPFMKNVPFPSSLLPNEASPGWNNKADNAWQLTAATLVGLQSVPGLVILYGSMVKRKWVVNSAFMALYAFAAVLICWVSWAHRMAFDTSLMPIVGKPNQALSAEFLLARSSAGYFPMADFVMFQFAFAAITVVLLAGSLLGRMNFYAWMMFVPLWLTLSYTIGAYTIWGNGFLHDKIIDYAGGCHSSIFWCRWFHSCLLGNFNCNPDSLFIS